MKLSDEEWKKRLTPEEYRILRKEGTEMPFSGVYNDCKDKGIYRCKGCGQELFLSDNKYDSGTGWPSFDRPFSEECVEYKGNEIHCKNCGGHLGHVFDDGPATTGKRFCINSCALKLEKHS